MIARAEAYKDVSPEKGSIITSNVTPTGFGRADDVAAVQVGAVLALGKGDGDGSGSR